MSVVNQQSERCRFIVLQWPKAFLENSNDVEDIMIILMNIIQIKNAKH